MIDKVSSVETMKFLAEATAEMLDSFLMAMSALVAHKLRSALTLVGVIIGVFSIIVVMTTMRAMQKNIEKGFARLGSESFEVTRYPGIHFDNSSDNQEYWRRKPITLDEGMALISRATLPRSIGLQEGMGRGNMTSAYSQGPPNVWLLGETPGSFPARTRTVDEGRGLVDSDVDESRDVCVLASSLARQLFPHSSAVGEQVVFRGIAYSVVGVLESNGTMPGGMQDNFAVIPLSTGLTRYYHKVWIDLAILVQVQSQADYDDTMDQVRGIMRVIRKVPPGKTGRFRDLLK